MRSAGRACGGVLRIAFGSRCCEIIPLAKSAVDMAGNLGSTRAASAAATAADQNNEHDFRMNLIGVRDVPAEATAERFVVTCAGLAERGTERVVAVRVVAASRGAVHYSGEHALTEIREQRRDVELTAHARREIDAIFARARIRQIIFGAAIGKRCGERGELQRRDADTTAEARHVRHTTILRREERQRAGLLFADVVANTLAEAEQAGILY